MKYFINLLLLLILLSCSDEESTEIDNNDNTLTIPIEIFKKVYGDTSDIYR